MTARRRRSRRVRECTADGEREPGRLGFAFAGQPGRLSLPEVYYTGMRNSNSLYSKNSYRCALKLVDPGGQLSYSNESMMSHSHRRHHHHAHSATAAMCT